MNDPRSGEADDAEGEGSARPAPEPAPEGTQPPASLITPERAEKYRDKLVDGALLALPIAAINWLSSLASSALFSQPWHALWIVTPLGVLAWLLLRRVIRRGSLHVRGPRLAFLIAYLSVFTVAAGSNLLVWDQETAALDADSAPRTWLAPGGWGDWRYRFVRAGSEPAPLRVITLAEPPTGSTGETNRLELVQVIAAVAAHGASGIALDFSFRPEPSELDGLLCATMEGAGVDVIGGRMLQAGAVLALVPRPYPDELEACVPAEHRGHLLGFRDGDGKIRHVPMGVEGLLELPPLSVRIARSLDAEVDLPTGRLLQFAESPTDYPAQPYRDLASASSGELDEYFGGHFVLVGESSANETLQTPFGETLGVQIHAASSASLMTGRWIQRPPWWASLLVIVVACYLMTDLVLGGASPRRIVSAGLAITAFLFAASALAMWLWLVWLDVIYAMAAIWVLSGSLLVLRKRLVQTDPAAS